MRKRQASPAEPASKVGLRKTAARTHGPAPPGLTCSGKAPRREGSICSEKPRVRGSRHRAVLQERAGRKFAAESTTNAATVSLVYCRVTWERAVWDVSDLRQIRFGMGDTHCRVTGLPRVHSRGAGKANLPGSRSVGSPGATQCLAAGGLRTPLPPNHRRPTQTNTATGNRGIHRQDRGATVLSEAAQQRPGSVATPDSRRTLEGAQAETRARSCSHDGLELLRRLPKRFPPPSTLPGSQASGRVPVLRVGPGVPTVGETLAGRGRPGSAARLSLVSLITGQTALFPPRGPWGASAPGTVTLWGLRKDPCSGLGPPECLSCHNKTPCHNKTEV